MPEIHAFFGLSFHLEGSELKFRVLLDFWKDFTSNLSLDNLLIDFIKKLSVVDTSAIDGGQTEKIEHKRNPLNFEFRTRKSRMLKIARS